MASTTTPAGSAAASIPVVLKVTFTLQTPDGQRKISFTLEKDADDTRTTWTITFTLWERQPGSTDFGDPIISLNVTVSPALHPNAQNVSKNGFTVAQVAHATGPAADSAKALAAGTGSHAIAANSIQNTLKS